MSISTSTQEREIVGGGGGRHLRHGQMGIVLQIQPCRPPLDPAQQQVLDGIERDRPHPQSIIDGLRDFRERERFHQPKDLYELALALLAQARFHQTVQFAEAFRQLPASQRRCLIQRIRLLLQQRQVMQGVEDHVFPEVVPLPRAQ